MGEAAGMGCLVERASGVGNASQSARGQCIAALMNGHVTLCNHALQPTLGARGLGRSASAVADLPWLAGIGPGCDLWMAWHLPPTHYQINPASSADTSHASAHSICTPPSQAGQEPAARLISWFQLGSRGAVKIILFQPISIARPSTPHLPTPAMHISALVLAAAAVTAQPFQMSMQPSHRETEAEAGECGDGKGRARSVTGKRGLTAVANTAKLVKTIGVGTLASVYPADSANAGYPLAMMEVCRGIWWRGSR